MAMRVNAVSVDDANARKPRERISETVAVTIRTPMKVMAVPRCVATMLGWQLLLHRDAAEDDLHGQQDARREREPEHERVLAAHP